AKSDEPGPIEALDQKVTRQETDDAVAQKSLGGESLKETRADVETLKKAAATTTQHLSEVEGYLRQVTAVNKDLAANLEKETTKFKNMVTQLEKDVNDLKKDVKDLKDDVKNKEVMISELSDRMQKLETSR